MGKSANIIRRYFQKPHKTAKSSFFDIKKETEWHGKVLQLNTDKRHYEMVESFCKKIEPTEHIHTWLTAILLAVEMLLIFLRFILREFDVNLVPDFVLNTIDLLILLVGIFAVVYCGILSYRNHYKNNSDSFSLYKKVVNKKWFIKNIEHFKKFNEGYYIVESVVSNNLYRTELNLNEACKLGSFAYGDARINKTERQNYYSKFKEGILTLIKTVFNESIGFFCVMALSINSHSRAMQFYRGRELTEFQINSNDISDNNSYLVFVQAVFLKLEYLIYREALIFTISSLLYKIATVLDKDEVALNQAIIISLPNSKSDRFLFELMGFEFYGNYSKDKQRFYELKFDSTNSENANVTKEIIKEFIKVIQSGNRKI